MHSPWGAMYPIMEKTGWTLHYILWKVSWANIQLILSDSPGVRTKTKSDKITLTGKQAADMFN